MAPKKVFKRTTYKENMVYACSLTQCFLKIHWERELLFIELPVLLYKQKYLETFLTSILTIRKDEI